MQNETIRLGDRNAKHSYEIQVGRGFETIKVDANTRAKAAKIAREAGYTVMAVNMVG